MAWEFLLDTLSSKGYFFIGALVAFWGVYSSRQIAKRKNATDVLLSARQDENYIKGLRTISELHNSSKENINTYAKGNKKDKKAMDIRYVLNHWEHISVGIQNGIYCELILKNASCNTVTKLYDKTKIFIDTVNEELVGSPTYYQEFRWLAKKWKKNPVTKKKGYERYFKLRDCE